MCSPFGWQSGGPEHGRVETVWSQNKKSERPKLATKILLRTFSICFDLVTTTFRPFPGVKWAKMQKSPLFEAPFRPPGPCGAPQIDWLVSKTPPNSVPR